MVLLELFHGRRDDWTLVGGQMMYLLALENGAALPRTTTDMDVVINVVESGIRAECGRKDLRRIAKLGAMLSADHGAWGTLGVAERRLGRATLQFLLG